MTIARKGHGAVLLQNRIYVVGGITGSENYDKTVEAYDFENDIWMSKAPMNNAKAYFGVRPIFNYVNSIKKKKLKPFEHNETKY